MNSLKEQKIINSGLWAAAGDAIGWISELTDENGLRRRISESYLLKPVGWNRKIGGYSGVTVSLPAGTYSDDTQLRLAVSRCIRGNGEFDIESFAKIELPVWLSYALGAGRASKAAATNLIRKDTNWFSNFYKNNYLEYTNSGGNGTAMRIQPHVWCCKNLTDKKYILSVIKDSLVTHGHLLAVCGSIFHADALQYSLINGKPASPNELEKIIDNFSAIPDAINSVYELKNFWLPNWENVSGKNLHNEVERIKKETKDYLNNAFNSFNKSSEPSENYKSAIIALECDKEERRGSATNTAIASSLLCYLFKDASPYEAIISCVNILGTDTDSIASMAGAILGCYSERPKWDIQDSGYIIKEAIRLSNISDGNIQENFIYPDINKWQSPQTQSDTLVKNSDGNYHVIGLGIVNPIGSDIWQTKTHAWQWMQFNFGQTILIKSKIGDIKTIEPVPLRSITTESKQPRLFEDVENKIQNKNKHDNNTSNYENDESSDLDIDKITTSLIKNGFNEQKLGHFLIQFADKKGLESCIGFAAIIGKAFIARKPK
ncbi:ADP-ribosylglycohydrolase family protein [Yersinia enterocolitica]|nr:ADP-ribosylglycohydrolase family protein [Yersinia enterocolitica]